MRMIASRKKTSESSRPIGASNEGFILRIWFVKINFLVGIIESEARDIEIMVHK